MRLTIRSLRNGAGLREKSARLGSLVGSSFNTDGTALYEAMAALSVAQMRAMALPEPLAQGCSRRVPC